ncbi:hypothetical protein [Klenkia soli]|uniref:hypothetical protein n=1 Tax=Klenkia soli TaxID=1052260 RepID=UPI0010424314|nr:hypothetical protein [Klenkia soli]
MTSAPTTASTATATPEQARRAWPWSALQGVVLVVLAVLAVVVADTGVRLLLAGLGVLGVLRGVAALRAARAGQVERSAAAVGAGAAWFGAVAIGLAFFPPAVAAWTCVVALAAVLAALVVRAQPGRRARAGLGAGLAVVALAVGAVVAGPTWLAAASVLAVSVAVLAAGVMSVTGALALRRVAAEPAAPVAAGCGGCACGAGGCGGLQRG